MRYFIVIVANNGATCEQAEATTLDEAIRTADIAWSYLTDTEKKKNTVQVVEVREEWVLEEDDEPLFTECDPVWENGTLLEVDE